MESKSNDGIKPYEENVYCKCLLNFSLSVEGLKRINFKNYENNFEFRFQNDKLLKVPDFLAEFISPVVSNMKAKNPKMNFLKVDEVVTDEIIHKFEELLHGQSVNIIDLEDPLINIFNQLKNPELIEKLPLEINNDNLINILNLKTKVGINIDKEIEYGAKHFEEIKEQNFSLSQLELLLKCDKLKLENEKSLLDFVIEKYQQNPEFYVLFKYIHCEFLEEEDSDRLTSIVNLLPHQKIGELWPSLSKIRGKRSDEEFRKRFLPFLFKYDGTNKFNGILDHLTKESNGNIITNGTIKVTASSVLDDKKYPLSSIVQDEGEFFTKNIVNQFILFDFKYRKVSLTSYSLKSVSSKWPHHFKSWKLEGSNDVINWTILDERSNDSSLNGDLQESFFEIQVKQGPFRYLKLTQTDYNQYGSLLLTLRRIEFFGRLMN